MGRLLYGPVSQAPPDLKLPARGRGVARGVEDPPAQLFTSDAPLAMRRATSAVSLLQGSSSPAFRRYMCQYSPRVDTVTIIRTRWHVVIVSCRQLAYSLASLRSSFISSTCGRKRGMRTTPHRVTVLRKAYLGGAVPRVRDSSGVHSLLRL